MIFGLIVGCSGVLSGRTMEVSHHASHALLARTGFERRDHSFMKRYLYPRTANFVGFLGHIASFFILWYRQCWFRLLIGEVRCHGGDVIVSKWERCAMLSRYVSMHYGLSSGSSSVRRKGSKRVKLRIYTSVWHAIRLSERRGR